MKWSRVAYPSISRQEAVPLGTRLSVSVIKLAATYLVHMKVLLDFLWHFQGKHCVNFVQNATVAANKKLTFCFRFYDCRIVKEMEMKLNGSWKVRTKGGKCSFGRWETFLVSTVCTERALVACCAGIYDCYVALLSCSLEAKLLLEAIARTICVKCTWRSTRYKYTAFFRCLLHYRDGTRVGCASPLFTASRKLVSSTQHWERSIIAVQSCLPIKRSRQCKNAHVRIYMYCRTVRKWKHYASKMIVQTKRNVNFLLATTVVLATFTSASASDHAWLPYLTLTLLHAPMVKNIHTVYAPLVHD